MLTRRRMLFIGAAIAVAGGLLVWFFRFPSDTTPNGAYMRIASAISRGVVEDAFAYLEEEAQQSSYTIADYASKACTRIRETYPEPARSEALARYEPLALTGDGPLVWRRVAERRGWIRHMRRDLSGAKTIEIVGERATVITVRGTRYPFRRRPNGIWGLTIFTAELTAEAERLARDWEVIQRAADDYERAVQ